MRLLAALLIAAWALPAAAEDGPFLTVLGIAQDAGYPQAGCYRPHCLPAWKDRALRRSATCLGLVVPETKQKYLFEATPQLPDQLYRLHRLAPDGEYALGGVFLTHAHIGHYTGLMHFGREVMGARGVPVYALPRLKGFLESHGPWEQLVQLGNIALRELQVGAPVQLGGGVSVRPIAVPHRDEYSETAGYHIQGPSRTALFVPDIDKWSKWEEDLATVVKSVDHALLDATFYAADELPGRDMAEIPHPFVVESMVRLKQLPAAERAKVVFIHFNHSNPLLDPESEASETVRAAGYRIAREGLRLSLGG